MFIGEKLKNCRKQVGFTQEYVAEQINVSRQTVSNWENGKTLPDIYSLVSLSELYEVSLDQLIKGDTIMIKKFKTDKDLKQRVKQLIILGSLGIITFSLGHNALLGNNHIDSLFMGIGTGLMIASIGVVAFLYLKNYFTNKKNAKDDNQK